MERLNTEIFIKRGIEIYGDRYSYDRSIYINNTTKVEVFCKKHQKYFWAIPRNFFKGHGCPLCGKESMAKTQSRTQENFIKKCQEIFKDKDYDFSKSIYKGSHEYVNVICHEKDIYGNEHGEFKIMAYHLIAGHGCRKCLDDYNRNRSAYTNEEFANMVKEKFGDAFDLSQVNYINSRTKVKIRCKKCNKILEVAPYTFLKGCGCYFCHGPILETEINKLLTENNIKYFYQYKNKKMLGRLSLDFYLPEHNIAIECQGEQHFRPVEWWGGIDSFNNLKEKDKRKFEECSRNNIKILYYTNSKIYIENYMDKIYTNKNDILKEILKQ